MRGRLRRYPQNMAAARRPPRSDPQNNQDFRPSATPRSPRSAALYRHANASVVEEQGEGRPAVEHVLDRLHEVGVPRDSFAACSHACLENLDDRRPEAGFPYGGAAMRGLLGALAVDRALDHKQRVDAAHDLIKSARAGSRSFRQPCGERSPRRRPGEQRTCAAHAPSLRQGKPWKGGWM